MLDGLPFLALEDVPGGTLAERCVRDGEPSRAEPALEQCRPELRRWEWWYLRRLSRVEVVALEQLAGRPLTSGSVTFIDATGETFGDAIAPDGSYRVKGLALGTADKRATSS